MKRPVETLSAHRLPALLTALAIVAAATTSLPSRGATAPLADLIDLHRLGAPANPTVRLEAPIAVAQGVAAQADSARTPDDCPALLQQTFTRLQGGEPQSLCQFRGKVLLVVNTASYCGFTRQYEGLEALYRKYKDRGLVVVGFPSNDFNQEPGTNTEVAEFCRTTYGVQFPMFEKQTVTKLLANSFYAELVRRSGQAPKWNFHKYVVDRTGTQVTSFGSGVEPDEKQLVALIERLLAAKSPPASG